MLSIGKVGVARDQQLYYEQKVARGADDYYAGRGESPGRWKGSAARQLGLTSELDAEQLKAVMDGRHPGTGVRLSARGPRSRTAAFDLTFSAPKSVSVLFAIGDERMSRAMVEAHEEAVDAALAFLEGEACRIRRGHNGTCGSSLPRIGIGCRGRRIHSYTRTSSARIWPRAGTADGPRWMGGRSTSTPRPLAVFMRRIYARL
jgi:hypothetical protein